MATESLRHLVYHFLALVTPVHSQSRAVLLDREMLYLKLLLGILIILVVVVRYRWPFLLVEFDPLFKCTPAF